MIGSAVAKRYAAALYDLAESKGATSEVGRGLAALAAAWQASEELHHVLKNPQFSSDDKRKVIDALCDRVRGHAILKNAMRMLADRQRLEHLPEIAEVFERLAEQRAGRMRAEVISAKPLPDTYYAKLTATLKKATGKDVVLIKKQDPSLIGGVVTMVGGRVFDGSLKNRLAGLRQELLASTDPALAGR